MTSSYSNLTWQLTHGAQKKPARQCLQPSLIIPSGLGSPRRLLALPLSRHMATQGSTHDRKRYFQLKISPPSFSALEQARHGAQKVPRQQFV